MTGVHADEDGDLARDGAGRDCDAEGRDGDAAEHDGDAEGRDGDVGQQSDDVGEREEDVGEHEEPAVAPERKAAALWALVGALTFGVLYQGAVLTGMDFEAVVLVGGMLAVGLATYALATVLQPRLPGAAQ